LNFDVFFSRVACAVVAGLPPDFKKDIQKDHCAVVAGLF
jgi:hypothetical protein